MNLSVLEKANGNHQIEGEQVVGDSNTPESDTTEFDRWDDQLRRMSDVEFFIYLRAAFNSYPMYDDEDRRLPSVEEFRERYDGPQREHTLYNLCQKLNKEIVGMLSWENKIRFPTLSQYFGAYYNLLSSSEKGYIEYKGSLLTPQRFSDLSPEDQGFALTHNVIVEDKWKRVQELFGPYPFDIWAAWISKKKAKE